MGEAVWYEAKSPLDNVVGLVTGAEDGDHLRTVAKHPGLDNIVVEAVEVLAVLRSAEREGILLQLGLQSIHLGLHVLRLEEGKSQVLPEQMRKDDDAR
jgi:hypothetical protein